MVGSAHLGQRKARSPAGNYLFSFRSVSGHLSVECQVALPLNCDCDTRSHLLSYLVTSVCVLYVVMSFHLAYLDLKRGLLAVAAKHEVGIFCQCSLVSLPAHVALERDVLALVFQLEHDPDFTTCIGLQLVAYLTRVWLSQVWWCRLAIARREEELICGVCRAARTPLSGVAGGAPPACVGMLADPVFPSAEVCRILSCLPIAGQFGLELAEPLPAAFPVAGMLMLEDVFRRLALP
jgi:hypothetical protein